MSRLRVLVVNENGSEAERVAGRLTTAQHSALAACGLEEASEALFVQKFDAILLGPELPADAVEEFTTKLRELERAQPGAAPAPVLSISAQIPDGRTWCAGDQGIDAYLAESFQASALIEAVTSLAAAIACGALPNREASVQLPVFEPERFREQVGQDADVMREIIELFLMEAPGQLIEMREAMCAGDLQRAGRVAHTIKGSLATLHAQQARAHAQQLESAAKVKDETQCRVSLSALERDLEILEPQLLLLASDAAGH